VSAHHRLAARHAVQLGELEREGVVSSLHWSQRLRDYWAGVEDGLDASYRVTALANNPGEWLSAIGYGSGISLCPASIASYYARADVSCVRVAGLATNAVGLAWRQDLARASAAQLHRQRPGLCRSKPVVGWRSRNGDRTAA
jgi:DNA-binding transcriptional LysR family regulator